MNLPAQASCDGPGDHHTPRPYVRQAFRKYLECGIFAHGEKAIPVWVNI